MLESTVGALICECSQKGYGGKPVRFPFPAIRLIYTEWGEPTSGLEPLTCSLRVMHQALRGVAQGCKCRISKPLSFLRLALRCTVLRSRWCQSGVKRCRRRWPFRVYLWVSPYDPLYLLLTASSGRRDSSCEALAGPTTCIRVSLSRFRGGLAAVFAPPLQSARYSPGDKDARTESKSSASAGTPTSNRLSNFSIASSTGAFPTNITSAIWRVERRWKRVPAALLRTSPYSILLAVTTFGQSSSSRASILSRSERSASLVSVVFMLFVFPSLMQLLARL